MSQNSTQEKPDSSRVTSLLIVLAGILTTLAVISSFFIIVGPSTFQLPSPPATTLTPTGTATPTATSIPTMTATATSTNTPTITATTTFTPTPSEPPTGTIASNCPSFSSLRYPVFPYEPNLASITSPANCRTGISGRREVRGWYAEAIQARVLWVLLYVKEVELYYPQAYDACGEEVFTRTVEETNVWRADVNFPEHRPEEEQKIYDIVLVMTDMDSIADTEFKGWFETGCATEDYPGYAEVDLPEGLTEIASITVASR